MMEKDIKMLSEVAMLERIDSEWPENAAAVYVPPVRSGGYPMDQSNEECVGETGTMSTEKYSGCHSL